MKWHRLMKRYGYQVEDGGVVYDPFTVLATLAKQQELPTATISVNVGASEEYASVKCAVTVTLNCPQDENNMNMAAELAFRKAVEWTNDGCSHLNMQQLPVPDEP